ncbi:hypothetical protein [Hyphomicrobium sp.]|uniref:hypothetical protein n=1 Tax=Hyphomicrobium sp. TaxID=82 RepID=UPI003F72C20D
MSDGVCSKAIYLSSLDPGMGKTSTVIYFLKALLASTKHEDIGVLICIERKEQILAFLQHAGLAVADFGILTADEGLNGLGRQPARDARVLFTTHAMIETRSSRRRFPTVSDFWFNGEPRQVRVWDEALLPGRPLTISRDGFAALLKPLRGDFPDLAEDLEELFLRLRDVKDGEVVKLQLATERDIEQNEVLRLVTNQPDLRQAVETLFDLFGKEVTVRREGRWGNAILDFKRTLPRDIAPVLVLDASGRVRTAYELWEARGGVRRLPPAPKRYSKLTIHHWAVSGGKTAFRERGRALLEGIAAAIRSKSDQRWLIVHHRTGINMDFEDELRALIADCSGMVDFIHWGAHDATNQYVEVTNVILAGTLFRRPSFNEALARLASDRPSSTGSISKAVVNDVMRGEHRHLILQALCRAAVRKSVGGECAPTSAYIIASPQSGIRGELPIIFPGARIVDWQPFKQALGGKAGEAFRYIETQLCENAHEHVSFRDVMAHIGWKSTKDFLRDIRKKPQFVAALLERSIEELGPGKRATCFRLQSVVQPAENAPAGKRANDGKA